jgi:hypothetical protein
MKKRKKKKMQEQFSSSFPPLPLRSFASIKQKSIVLGSPMFVRKKKKNKNKNKIKNKLRS